MEYPTKGFKRFLPGYKRKSITLDQSGRVTLHDLNWSGGTKSTYAVRDIETGQKVSDTAKYEKMAPWVNPAEGATLDIPRGAIVVRTGWFCGKESLATIYVNPSDVHLVLT